MVPGFFSILIISRRLLFSKKNNDEVKWRLCSGPYLNIFTVSLLLAIEVSYFLIFPSLSLVTFLTHLRVHTCSVHEWLHWHLPPPSNPQFSLGRSRVTNENKWTFFNLSTKIKGLVKGRQYKNDFRIRMSCFLALSLAILSSIRKDATNVL